MKAVATAFLAVSGVGAAVLGSGSITLTGSSSVAAGTVRDGNVRLYAANPASRARQSNDQCPESEESTTVSIAPEVCMSGDKYLHNNVRIEEAPVCADGQMATLVIYPRRRCQGPPTSVNAGLAAQPKGCLWQDEYYWSFVFQCNPTNWMSYNAEAHVDAVLPPTTADKMPQPSSASVRTFFAASCSANSNRGPVTVPADRCLTFTAMAMRIYQPAVCANGTRALVAGYTTERCNEGDINSVDSFIDLNDEDVGSNVCLPTAGVLEVPGKSGPQNLRSIMFWCDPNQEAATTPAPTEGEEQPIDQPDPVKDDPSKDKPAPKQGSIVGLILILLLIGLIMLLGAVFAVLKWASLLHRILDLFGKREGEIRL